jgi:ABC-2 type transport system ATP-binding protein
MNEVREIVKSLKSKDRLIFMSSHLLSEVSELCDDIAIIDHGKLLAYDTLQSVTAKFSGGGNVIEVGLIRPIDEGTLTKSVSKVPGVLSAERADSKGLRLKFTGGPESQERILAELVKLGIGVVSFRPAGSQLEDVYLNLIKETL